MCWPGVSCLYNIFSNNLPSFVQMQSSGKLLPLLCSSSAQSLSLLCFGSGSAQFWLFNRSISVQAVGNLFEPYRVHTYIYASAEGPATCHMQPARGRGGCGINLFLANEVGCREPISLRYLLLLFVSSEYSVLILCRSSRNLTTFLTTLKPFALLAPLHPCTVRYLLI